MRATAMVLGWIVLLSAAPSSSAQQPAAPIPDETVVSLAHGSTAKLDWGEFSMKGELLSVSADSIWFDMEGSFRSLPLAQVERIQIQRHAWDTNRVLIWNLVAGLGSTVALTAACGSVEDTDCGPFTLTWLGLWAVIGGFSGANIAGSSHVEVPIDPEGLRRFTRFPQGMPESYLRSRR